MGYLKEMSPGQNQSWVPRFVGWIPLPAVPQHPQLCNLACSYVSGDNILTAVNVAQTCGMVASHEKVIFVHASAPTGHSPAALKFELGLGEMEEGASQQEMMDVFSQVCKNLRKKGGLFAVLPTLRWGLKRGSAFFSVFAGASREWCEL